MKKSGNQRSVEKPNVAPDAIDKYSASVPEPARTTLNKTRAAIRSAMPKDATETISYGIPAFQYNEVRVWFAAFSKHCSFFPGSYIIEKFKNELRGFKISKGTIRFPVDKPLRRPL